MGVVILKLKLFFVKICFVLFVIILVILLIILVIFLFKLFGCLFSIFCMIFKVRFLLKVIDIELCVVGLIMLIRLEILL